MVNPLVSWLMSVYNAEKFIMRAIDSILNQTYQHFEVIIIIEYGCADATRDICELYAAKDKRIKVFHNSERLGIPRSLNRGLQLCGGRYIARMDADDYAYPTRLEKQVAHMEMYPDIGVLGAWINMAYEDGTAEIYKFPTDSRDIRAELLFNCAFAHPVLMLRTNLFRQNNWVYPDVEAEDYALWCEIMSKTRLEALPEVLLDYYNHNQSASSRRVERVCACYEAISKKTLHDELGVDTTVYPNYYFGGRYVRTRNEINEDYDDFLFRGAALLREIEKANRRTENFDVYSLSNALWRSWHITKSMVGLSALTIGYDAAINDSLVSDIEMVKSFFNGNPTVVIYGTGTYCVKVLKEIENNHYFNITAFCDSNIMKHGTCFMGKQIISPEQLQAVDCDFVLIATPLYGRDVWNKLVIELHYPKEKVFNLPYVHEFEKLKNNGVR